MQLFKDVHNQSIRLDEERRFHLETEHPEMTGQLDRIAETLANPDKVIRSRTDATVELFYRHYQSTPVTSKYLCTVVKVLSDDHFIITTYFTDAMKRGEVLWEKK